MVSCPHAKALGLHVQEGSGAEAGSLVSTTSGEQAVEVSEVRVHSLTHWHLLTVLHVPSFSKLCNNPLLSRPFSHLVPRCLQGVHLTLPGGPLGSNYLTRVRFSRSCFTKAEVRAAWEQHTAYLPWCQAAHAGGHETSLPAGGVMVEGAQGRHCPTVQPCPRPLARAPRALLAPLTAGACLSPVRPSLLGMMQAAASAE